MFWKNFFNNISMFFENSGLLILKLALLFALGYITIRLILRFVTRVMSKSKIDKVARNFIRGIIKYSLYLMLLMILFSAAGVSITGFVAVLSAAGLAVSLALQGSLSNLANGIILIITKPFKQGDVISVSSHEGTIKEVGMLHTIITGFDNKEISVPNKIIVENAIINSSVNATRKITFNFLVAYKTDIEKAKEIINKIFASTNLILSEPAPFVSLSSLEQNGITIIAMCHVESKNYGKIYYPLLEEIFNEFKRAGIVFPHAQLEVNVKNDKDTSLPFRKEKKLPQNVETVKEIKTKTGKEIMNEEELEELAEFEERKKPFKEILKEKFAKSHEEDQQLENKQTNTKSNKEEVDEDDDDNDDNYNYLDLVNEVNIIEEDGDEYEPNPTTTFTEKSSIDEEIEKLFEEDKESEQQKSSKWTEKIFGKNAKKEQYKKSRIIIKK